MKVVKVFVRGLLVEEYPDCYVTVENDWIRVKARGDITHFDSVCKFPKISPDISVLEMEQKDKT
jgi:hypothetical protein